MKKTLALLLLASTPATAQTGGPVEPFGLRQGLPISELLKMGAKPLETPGYYRLDRVPNPNSNFEFYTVKASPEQGLCRVRGVGVIIRNDKSGYRTRQVFNDLETSLNNKYGKGLRFDFLKSSSIWDETNDWMMAIRTEDRYLTTFWSVSEGLKLPRGLDNIMLNVNALNSSDGYVDVSYEFSNMKACTDELKGDVGKGL
ncbi:hypothetical protein [Deinococcus sp. YIM 77859]|uniref:hypothetical protein n=1 Tax=Deinococcus sp. YIM 77859 TaxID=1540221 RepID=UPI00068E3305|nr:hypothetical protein [Deinococcus sp. YIM 77859]